MSRAWKIDGRMAGNREVEGTCGLGNKQNMNLFIYIFYIYLYLLLEEWIRKLDYS